MNNVTIFRGFFNDGSEVSNTVLPLNFDKVVKTSNGPFGTQYVGSFNTVNSSLPKQREKARIFFKSTDDFSYGGDAVFVSNPVSITTTTSQIPQIPEKSDEEIKEELAEKFDILNLVAEAVSRNTIRSLVVSGSPGTGKSFGVQKIMEERAKKDQTFYYVTLKGSVSPISFYSQLYECRSKNCVLILDDCDMALDDMESLNMLKAATDTSRRRNITYFKLANFLAQEGIPHEFEFEGSIIYLSNINFQNELERKSKLAPHISAFISRSHYIDVTLNSAREKMIRILMVAESEGFAKEHNLSSDQVEEIIFWTKENQEMIRELSIRLVGKLADLIKSFPKDWQRIARVTLCKNK